MLLAACGAAYLAYLLSQAPRRADSSRHRSAVSQGKSGRRALLVGCGSYLHRSIRPLEGPINDVRLMKEVLVDRCGFSPDEITTLAGAANADDAPTRANIEHEFRRLQATARQGDQVVVLLCGHGSQQPNQADDFKDSEPDGLDEIFLPIDAELWSDADGTDASGSAVNAIIDDEICRWTAGIADKGATVWVICDFCCAGTAVRGGYQEVPRFVSPNGALKPPETVLSRTGSLRSAEAPQRDESHWEALPNEGIVALYACQAHESELELTLPPATADANVERAKHGLLTYALCCALSQPGGESLTYRDLVRDIWLRYRAWGRASPTPFADGAIDRRVLGERAASGRFRVARTSGRAGVIDAGALQGLSVGSILAWYSPNPGAAGVERRPDGYARVAEIQPTTARIVPCAYGEVQKTNGVEIGAWCELAYADFGDMRLSVASDERSAQGDGPMSVALIRLTEELSTLADVPTSVFYVVDDVSAADWVIQARNSALELLPKSAAQLPDGEPLPLGAPHFVIDATNPAESAARILHRVFRARNLIKLASISSYGMQPGRTSLKLKVELLSNSAPLEDGAVLVPDQEVQWKITNEGTDPVDLTLLFIDSEMAIAAAFPLFEEPADNRLAPGDCFRRDATVRGNTLGAEHLVAIAARARGPQRDFRCLAEPSLTAAQNLAAAARGGEEEVLQSPFGRLMRYALYNDGLSAGATRGLASANVRDCSLTLRAWAVKPN
ncbi:MAG TPA: caspase family protein [Pirellulales bacterium]|nr:caspase family protein [Pirellulales bacterium]